MNEDGKVEEFKTEKIIERRENKIVNWFKNPYNLALAGILLLAFALRLYYFIHTSGQALWWDEAEYMSTATKWAFGTPYDLNPQRPPLFQFIAALAFMIGLGESFIRFAFVLIPSVFLVFTIYLLGNEMFDRKIGLIAAFLATVSWTFLFWTARVQPDFFSMVFSVMAVFFMWKHWKNKSTKYVILSGLFAALGFYFKVSALLVPMIFIVFILIKDRFSALKNKHYWYFALAFIVTLIPYFMWSYITFSTPTAFTAGYVEPVAKSTPFGWYNFKFYYLLTENIIFILFIIGVILGLRFLLYSDLLIKNKEKCFDPSLFSILALLVISAFYIFHIKNTDDRWVYMWLPFIFMLAGNAVTFIYSMLKKYNKILAVIVVIALLAFAGYNQVKHANSITDAKKESYMPVKEAGLWLQQNAQKEDKLLSISYTQSVYYSRLNVSSYSEIMNTADFTKYLDENRPRYLQVSVFEPHPPWINEWISQNQGRITPVQAYFADAEKNNVLLVIYEIKYQ